MESQKAIKIKGGTMRLGSYKCEIEPKTQVAKTYKRKAIHETLVFFNISLVHLAIVADARDMESFI